MENYIDENDGKPVFTEEEVIKIPIETITYIEGDYNVTILPSGARIEERISDEVIVEDLKEGEEVGTV